MIWNQGPGVTLRLGFFEDDGEPLKERLAVLVIEEDFSSLYSSGHNMLKDTRSIKSGLAWHFLLAVVFCYRNYFHFLFR